jgi:hypothetical protein
MWVLSHTQCPKVTCRSTQQCLLAQQRKVRLADNFQFFSLSKLRAVWPHVYCCSAVKGWPPFFSSSLCLTPPEVSVECQGLSFSFCFISSDQKFASSLCFSEKACLTCSHSWHFSPSAPEMAMSYLSLHHYLAQPLSSQISQHCASSAWNTGIFQMCWFFFKNVFVSIW